MKRTMPVLGLLTSLLILAPAHAQADAASLEVWNDPGFQKRFAESYAAETDIEPRVTKSERDLMEKVLGFIGSDEMERAASLLDRLRDEKSSAVLDFTLANIEFQREKLDEAAAAYATAVQKYPKFRRAWRNLGLIHVRRNQFEEALPALTRVIELGGGDAITYGLLGFAYAGTGDELAAETAYRMALLLDPATVDWKMGLARSLFGQQRFADAAALCGNLIRSDPENTDLWLLQANAYIGLGKPLEAAQNFELVDRLGGSTVESLNLLGDIYINEELFDLAVTTYVRALEADAAARPDRALRAARLLTARGAVLETKHLVERIETLRGDRLSPEDRKDLLKLRARIAVAEGSGDDEARVLEEIIELDPLDGEALILLGQHSARTGDTAKAAFYYERAAGLERFEADAKVRHAQLLVGEGRYDQALPLLRRAQLLKPRDNIQEYLEQVERIAKAR